MRETATAWTDVKSPLGRLRLEASSKGLMRLSMGARRGADLPPPPIAAVRDQDLMAPYVEAVERYFNGDSAAFKGVRLDTPGTPFFQACWKAVRSIPWGETRSYQWVAGKAGNPRAVRAAGSANARNPVGIVVPCHRVVAAGFDQARRANASDGASGAAVGKLGGYGGGLDRKVWLLDHERATPHGRTRTGP